MNLNSRSPPRLYLMNRFVSLVRTLSKPLYVSSNTSDPRSSISNLSLVLQSFTLNHLQPSNPVGRLSLSCSIEQPHCDESRQLHQSGLHIARGRPLYTAARPIKPLIWLFAKQPGNTDPRTSLHVVHLRYFQCHLQGVASPHPLKMSMVINPMEGRHSSLRPCGSQGVG